MMGTEGNIPEIIGSDVVATILSIYNCIYVDDRPSL